jgi:urease accessory protein
MTTTIPTSTRTGQHGELRLKLEKRGAKTSLTGRYFTVPFGPTWAIYPDATGTPELQITHPAGGVLGGDGYEIDVTLEADACATVLTTGATKAYRGPQALQRAVFRIGQGAFLEHLPHHVIPFAGSAYRQETTFRLAPDATLLAWDAYSAGRVARGERFAFTALSNRTRLFRGNVSEILEGFDLPGGGEPFGGYSYLGTVYASAPRDLAPQGLELLAEELHAALSGSPVTLASASTPAPGLCVTRVLARGAPALYRALNAARAAAREFLELPPPARELR